MLKYKYKKILINFYLIILFNKIICMSISKTLTVHISYIIYDVNNIIRACHT